ncbi:hypothetical protein A5662_03925 [Mycobacteriaceae bacterium 1482268.1]|nr:hypothetical protein A5662_03925 [Mycobacteriaceae bacterium 1482268.1]
MRQTRLLRGTELRYALTMTLIQDGKSTIPELIEKLEDLSFEIPGYAPKAVSDALRWEMRKDRVRRVRRGFYCRGQMPTSTESYIRRRFFAMRDEAAELNAESDKAFWDALLGPALS